MTPPRLTIIAAVARNRIIGRGNEIPWRLAGDMIHFRDATMGKPVVMGRRTYESIGKPLRGRFLVVVSRDPGFAPAGVDVARDTDEALDRARAQAADHGATEIMVAGGGQIYATLLPQMDQLLLTEVDAEPEGDTRFPDIDPAQWTETERRSATRGTADDAAYAFVRYVRRA